MKHLVFMIVLMLVLSIAVAYGISWAFAIEFTGKYLIGFTYVYVLLGWVCLIL